MAHLLSITVSYNVITISFSLMQARSARIMRYALHIAKWIKVGERLLSYITFAGKTARKYFHFDYTHDSISVIRVEILVQAATIPLNVTEWQKASASKYRLHHRPHYYCAGVFHNMQVKIP